MIQQMDKSRLDASLCAPKNDYASPYGFTRMIHETNYISRDGESHVGSI